MNPITSCTSGFYPDVADRPRAGNKRPQSDVDIFNCVVEKLNTHTLEQVKHHLQAIGAHELDSVMGPVAAVRFKADPALVDPEKAKATVFSHLWQLPGGNVIGVRPETAVIFLPQGGTLRIDGWSRPVDAVSPFAAQVRPDTVPSIRAPEPFAGPFPPWLERDKGVLQALGGGISVVMRADDQGYALDVSCERSEEYEQVLAFVKNAQGDFPYATEVPNAVDGYNVVLRVSIE